MNYDQFISALCLWREARGCTKDEMNAIWHVLLNRVKDPKGRWPKSLHLVVLQPKQFSSFNSGDPNSLLFPKIINKVDWDAFQVCMDTVAVSLGDDPTLGATNYEDCTGQLPIWADESKKTVEIGSFRFYKL